MVPLTFLNATPLSTITHCQRPKHTTRCPVKANYLQPTAFSIDFGSSTRFGNFGAVFFGQYTDPGDANQTSVDIVVKCPVESELSRKLYDMERHTNLKLQKNNSSIRRFPSFLGELVIPPGIPLAAGLAPLGLVWRQAGSGDTLEQYLNAARVDELASVLGTTATQTPLRRQLAATLVRELSYILQDLQSCGIVHRDVKPENLLVVKNDPGGAVLQAIDFGSSCDWSGFFKKGLRLATCDPIYTAPERRLDRLKPPFRFDVYSIALIALRAALPSLTSAADMDNFVNTVLAKGRFSIARACASVRFGRIQAPQSLKEDLRALESAGNEELYGVLATMLTETPDERAEVSDCLRNRFVQSGGL